MVSNQHDEIRHLVFHEKMVANGQDLFVFDEIPYWTIVKTARHRIKAQRDHPHQHASILPRKILATRGSTPGPRAFRTPRAPGKSGFATLLASHPGVLQAPNTSQRVQGYKCQGLRNYP